MRSDSAVQLLREIYISKSVHSQALGENITRAGEIISLCDLNVTRILPCCNLFSIPPSCSLFPAQDPCVVCHEWGHDFPSEAEALSTECW